MDTELNRFLLRISIASGAEKAQDVNTSLIQNWKNEQGKLAKRAKLRQVRLNGRLIESLGQELVKGVLGRALPVDGHSIGSYGSKMPPWKTCGVSVNRTKRRA